MTINVDQRTYLYFDIEMKSGGQWLRAVTLSSHTDHELMDSLKALAFISPFLLVIIIVGGCRILKKALSPVDQLSQTALDIRESGDFSKRLVLKDKDDELHRLGKAFNLMLDSVEASFQREKQFNHDVSHELRTPVLDLSKLENQAKLVKTNHIALLKGCFYLGSQYNYKFLL